MIETSQLQTLVNVARARSFSRAAEELQVTQSAISQSIKNLEKKIGVTIFKRAGKTVILTPEGEKIYELAKEFLGRMNSTLDEIRQDKDTMSGKVRIGTLTGIGKSWLANEFLDFSEAYPDLTVQVTLAFQEQLVEEFKRYNLDILILPEEHLPSVGESVSIFEEKSVLVFPDTPEFNIYSGIELEELLRYPTILFQEEDHLFLKWCEDKFGNKPKTINKRLIVNSHGAMLGAVQRGLGIAVVPHHVFHRSFYRDKVNTLGEDYEVSNGRFSVVYHKNATELLRIREVINLVTKNANPIGQKN